jgi:hypothetical protein
MFPTADHLLEFRKGLTSLSTSLYKLGNLQTNCKNQGVISANMFWNLTLYRPNLPDLYSVIIEWSQYFVANYRV